MSGKTRQYARRAKEYGMNMIQEWKHYFLTPIIDQYGKAVQGQWYAYIIHGIVSVFSETLIRVVLSFAYTMALVGVNAGTINFTLAAIIKATALGGMIMMMGRISAYCRMENVLASWIPSSKRMFSVDAIQPYVDFFHGVGYVIFQYLGSLVGVALALWVTNFSTINVGLPSTTADTFGVFGPFGVSASDLWLIEIYGSAVLTFVWLMVVVFQRGVKHHIYAGLAVGMASLFMTGATISASGANFDFIHYAALRTILANTNVINTNYTAQYLAGSLIGMVVAWVGYVIVAWLSYSIDYGRPGIADYKGDYDPLLANSILPVMNHPKDVVVQIKNRPAPRSASGHISRHLT